MENIVLAPYNIARKATLRFWRCPRVCLSGSYKHLILGIDFINQTHFSYS
jgi:hypothetical protein